MYERPAARYEFLRFLRNLITESQNGRLCAKYLRRHLLISWLSQSLSPSSVGGIPYNVAPPSIVFGFTRSSLRRASPTQLNFAKQEVMNLDIPMRLTYRKRYVSRSLLSFASSPPRVAVDTAQSKSRFKLTAVVLIILRRTPRLRLVLPGASTLSRIYRSWSDYSTKLMYACYPFETSFKFVLLIHCIINTFW